MSKIKELFQLMIHEYQIFNLILTKGGIMENEYVSISKMASLHHLTRQTLIYYDHIGLLKPVYVNEHGYRYYSVYQIPFLREICLLKKLGVKLEDIKKSIENRNPDSVINLLEKQKNQIEEQIQELNRTSMHLQQRINFYEDTRGNHMLNTPIIKTLPPRKVLYMPFQSKPSKDILRFTLMEAWNLLYDYSILPSNGFGTLIRQSSFHTEDLYKYAGIFVVLPDTQENTSILNISGIEDIPGTTYACMYKYSFPYDEKDFLFLIKWIQEQQYEIVGDALDVCLLDATFYTSENEVDYCCLQIPVRKL